MLRGLERGAAAGAAAKGSDDHRQTDVPEILVHGLYGGLRGKAPVDDVAPRAPAGQPVAADQEEVVSGSAGSRVGVDEQAPEVLAEGAAYAARNGAAGSSDADEKHAGVRFHFPKNLPSSPSSIDFSS